MKYERFTTKGKYGRYIIDCVKCGECNVREQYYGVCETGYRKMVNLLAELEDKIEQGMLIELPCKVGDTVYFVDKQNKIIEEFDIIGIEISITPYSDGKTNRIYIAEKGTGKRDFDYILFFGWIGNMVFFTREEAEKRLKELQE